MKLAFLGGGNMGGALAGGMIRAGTAGARDIWVYDADNSKLSALRKRLGIRACASNAEAARRAGLVFICVKPGMVKAVLPEISRAMQSSRSRKVVVSIAAGVPISTIQAGLPWKTPVIRVMPNTPALLGAGMMAIAGGRWANRGDVSRVKKLLSSVGATVVLPERHMDAVTAVSGSGPAYAFYLCEAMLSAARRLGLPAAAAELLCRQTLYGAGLMLKERPEQPALLRRQVTSPGGTTEAALKLLERRGVGKLIAQAAVAAARRARELSKRST